MRGVFPLVHSGYSVLGEVLTPSSPLTKTDAKMLIEL